MVAPFGDSIELDTMRKLHFVLAVKPLKLLRMLSLIYFYPPVYLFLL